MNSAADREWARLRREACTLLEVLREPTDLVWSIGPGGPVVLAWAGDGKVLAASGVDALTALRELVSGLRERISGKGAQC